MNNELTIEQLEAQLKNIDIELIVLKNSRTVIRGELQYKLNMNLGECNHKEVRKGGGFAWANTKGYYYYEIWYECLKCGKVFLESFISTRDENDLEESVVEALENPSF